MRCLETSRFYSFRPISAQSLVYLVKVPQLAEQRELSILPGVVGIVTIRIEVSLLLTLAVLNAHDLAY